jgi:Leucine-rich repeat (LRR) protein
MKLFSLVLLIGLLQIAHAQVKIMSFGEAHKQGLTEAYLDSIIRLEEKKFPTTKANRFLNDGVFTRRQNALSQKIFGTREGALLHYKLYFSKEGRFDYLLYQIEGKISDDNKKQFLDSLQVLTNQYRASIQLNSPHVSHHVIRLGIIRSIPKGDSIISKLEAALATTRPDTVKILALNQLELKTIPDVIYRFTEMQELILGSNELKSATIDVTRLPKLRHIWLNNNQLTDTSIHIPKNQTLKVLNLQNNRLTDVPQAVRNCQKLTSLWLGYNKLTQLTSNSFKGLRRLQDLNLYSCEISALPQGIGKLRRLEVLDLYYNEIKTLPNSLTRMRRLQQLALSNNQLTALPSKIGRLKRLYALYAHHNKLSALPTNLKRLRNLKILDINHNQFSTLPKQIGTLRVVEEIDISYNNLSEIPAQLPQLRQLKKLYLRENPVAEDAMLLSRSKPVLESLEHNKTDVSY